MKKVLIIKNAPHSFVNFLMAMNIPFHWSNEETTIENTHDAFKFKNYCLKHGVRATDIDQMEITEVDM